MKISNEMKVGAMTVIALALLIFGFNFLKGKSLFKTGNYLFAKYKDTKGIMISNSVFIKGYKVGSVYEIESADADLKEIIVTIKLDKPYNIPKNSVAIIKEIILATPTVDIELGNDTHFLKTGDTIPTAENEGLMNSFADQIAPVGNQLRVTLHSLDSILNNANSMLDANTKNNLKQAMVNLNATTASLSASASALQTMLNAQTGSITQTMNNANSFTKNLAENNEKINKSMDNLEKTTENFANADIDGTVAALKKAVDNMDAILEKVNSKDGSVGLFLNDKTLFNNLTNTIRSANVLMDDIKVHPKRYINISVFGNKDKSVPLTAPLSTDTSSHP